MSPNEIAEETGLSYVTVRKYLKRLLEKGVITEDDY
jgi:DNA-binding Lrp family transcriptional regulator